MYSNSNTKPFLYLTSTCDITISYKNAVHKFPLDSITDVRLVKEKKMERFYLLSCLWCLSQGFFFYINNNSVFNTVSGSIVSLLLLRIFFFQQLITRYYLYVYKHNGIKRIAISKADKISAISSVCKFLEIRFAKIDRENNRLCLPKPIIVNVNSDRAVSATFENLARGLKMADPSGNTTVNCEHLSTLDGLCLAPTLK